MARIRAFEENLAAIYPRGLVRCPVHLAIGHEAAAVGVCEALETRDLALGYHRSHHHYLAKGGDPRLLLLELLGDPEGCSGGRGGSTHLKSEESGFLGSTAIIAGTLPVASGVAHAEKLAATGRVTVAFCGDAAIEEGVFLETLNLARLWELPLLVVVEDNDLSCYTPRSQRQGFRDWASVAKLFGIEFRDADGSDVGAVHAAASDLVHSVRSTSRPALLRIPVYRAHEHCGPDRDDALSYRAVEGQWPDRDPIERGLASLDSSSREQAAAMLREIRIEEARWFASVLQEKARGEGS